jgi:cellulose synthase/poly-beta-1,6-N-acetylglucosamine synthase-like glycosyltransferase
MGNVIAATLVIVSLCLLAHAIFSLFLVLQAWNEPRGQVETVPKTWNALFPRVSFTVLIPAREEESVIFSTVRRIAAADYPPHLIEIIVVCHEGDVGTIAEARRAAVHADGDRRGPFVRLQTFTRGPLSKPRALNVGLEAARHDVVVVFDAEDEVDAAVFDLFNSEMAAGDCSVVQAAIQPRIRPNWFSAHAAVEYYFHFKSRLPYLASRGFVPLGGNTVAIRRDLLLRVGGWDERCLTEDAEIGLRLSVIGEAIRVVYDARRATREELPPDTASLIRQRTRWHQGFLQVLRKGLWRKLPRRRQQLLSLYVFASPVFSAAFALSWIPATAGWLWLDLPLPVALASILPAYGLLLHCLVAALGTVMLLREFREKCSAWLPVWVAASFVPYSMVTGYAALRAVGREIRGVANWEKTPHPGPRGAGVGLVGRTSSGLPPEFVAASALGPIEEAPR